ncbi:MAG: GTP-binding protein [Candidatus Lokiarchaeota archaeon]|nr:GTP-binding protein [Candidatus Lokiarchaeota archaeon]
MDLILMHFNEQKGPIAFDAIPRAVTKDVEAALVRLFDVSENEGFFEHNSKVAGQPFSCANYLFYMDSQWARGKREMAMLSLTVDDDIKPMIFEDTLAKFATALKSIKDGYKCFYINSNKKDPGIEKAHKLVKLLITDCYEACRRKPEAQKPGRMLILGLQAVGKSSIINQVTTRKYSPNIKPTLGMQIIKSAVDNFKFQIYDLGGQEKIRQGWYDKTKSVNPNAVIFVIDATATKEQLDESKFEFDRMVENFFRKDSPSKIAENTPVLILGNKIDLNPSFTEKTIDTLLKPAKAGLNYRIGLCSALNNDGIEDNFKWLVKSFLFV